MISLFALFALLAVKVGAQADASAAGVAQTLSSIATFVGQASGDAASVVGTAFADATSASSSVVATASSKPTAKPPTKYHPPPTKYHKPPTKHHEPPTKHYPTPSKKYIKHEPVCKDIKDDKCYEIDDYKKCGFCVVESYPKLHGYACEYKEEIVYKKGGKKYETEKVLVPLCDCKGKFIYEADYCPSCDKLLKPLLECAAVEVKDGEAVISEELFEKCILKLEIDTEYLIKCGFLKKEKEEHKPVVLKKDPKIVLHKEKKDPKIVVVGKTHKPDYKKETPKAASSATATATASAAKNVAIADATAATVGNAQATAGAAAAVSGAAAEAAAAAASGN